MFTSTLQPNQETLFLSDHFRLELINSSETASMTVDLWSNRQMHF